MGMADYFSQQMERFYKLAEADETRSAHATRNQADVRDHRDRRG
jgi:hypothetical protein